MMMPSSRAPFSAQVSDVRNAAVKVKKLGNKGCSLAARSEGPRNDTPVDERTVCGDSLSNPETMTERWTMGESGGGRGAGGAQGPRLVS